MVRALGCSNIAGASLSDTHIVPHWLTIVKAFGTIFFRYSNRTKGVQMPSLTELERWMSTSQVSTRLGYSRQGTINLAESRKIRAVKTAAGWLYDPDSVEAFAGRIKAGR